MKKAEWKKIDLFLPVVWGKAEGKDALVEWKKINLSLTVGQ